MAKKILVDVIFSWGFLSLLPVISVFISMSLIFSFFFLWFMYFSCHDFLLFSLIARRWNLLFMVANSSILSTLPLFSSFIPVISFLFHLHRLIFVHEGWKTVSIPPCHWALSKICLHYSCFLSFITVISRHLIYLTLFSYLHDSCLCSSLPHFLLSLCHILPITFNDNDSCVI